MFFTMLTIDDVMRFDANDFRFELEPHLVMTDERVERRQYPRFDGRTVAVPAIKYRDVGTGLLELDGRVDGGVLPTDDRHTLPIERMRLFEIVGDVRQLFTGHVKPTRASVIARRQDDIVGLALFGTVPVVSGPHDETVLGSLDRLDRLERMDIEPSPADDFPIVDECVLPAWLQIFTDERDIPDFKQIGRREERLMGRIPIDGIDDIAALDNRARDADAFQFDRSRQPARSGADDDSVFIQ